MNAQRLADAKRAWEDYHERNRTYEEIASEHGWTRGRVAGLLRDYAPAERTQGGRKAENVIADDPNPLLDEIRQLRAEYAKLKASIGGMYEPSARDDTDWEQWDIEYKRLSQLGRMVVVMTMNDLHIPDDDEQAVELWFQIYAITLPDVVIFGSDAFDFDVLSLKYKRMYNRRRKDPFLEVQPRYDGIVGRMKAINPKVIIIALGDNHAQIRLESFINELIPVFGDRITADYNELVRSDNRVLWLGWQQEVYIGNAIFEHGRKAGANPALANFKSHGESFTDVSGHAHKYQTLAVVKQQWLHNQRRMLYYPLMSVVTGTLQHVPPHYITDTKAINSTQGCSVSHVNLHGLDTHVQNILFHPREDGTLTAVFGSQVFEQSAVIEFEKVA